MADVPDRFVVRVMTTLLVVSVVMQGVVIPVGGSMLFFDIVPQYVALAVLFFSGRLTLSPTRLLIFILAFGSAIILQTFVVRQSSLTSMYLALFIYASYMFVIDITQATYMRIIALFQYVALGICLLVYLDIAVQFAHLDMPDINRVFPSGIMVQSYNYIQPLFYGSRFMKPNAIFMLEASFTSQFIALGLVIEMSFFQRRRMVIAMIIGLLATFATTGVLLVIASLPFVGRRYWRQALALSVVVLPLLLVGAYASGWLEVMQTRAEGIDRIGSSFSGRFVVPYTAMWDLVTTGSETDIIGGWGAGAATRLLEAAEYTSMSRSLIEYGFLFFIFFTGFLTYCFFSTGVPFIVAWIVFLNYNFLSGNFHLPSSVIYAFVLAAGYAVKPSDKRRAPVSQASKPGRTPMTASYF